MFLMTVFFVDISRAEVREGIPLSKVPKSVIKAVKNQVRGIRILDAEKITKSDGQVFYSIDGALGQDAHEVMVDSQGKILQGGFFQMEKRKNISLSRVPGFILLKARKEVNGIKVMKAYFCEEKNGTEFFELEGMRGKKTYQLTIGLDGEVLSNKVIYKRIDK